MFDWLYLLQAAFLGIVEGLTEFLPVSSTGHLIVAADLVGFTDATSDTFVVAIQAGAILAVCWYYRMRTIRVLRGLFSEPVQQRLVVNTLVAFLPAAVVGVLVSDLLKTYLFNPLTVATALVIGGLIILYVEHRHEKLGIEPRVKEMDDMDWKDALKVGVAQCLAMIPGTSRSGATIIGGLIFGLSRKARHHKRRLVAQPFIGLLASRIRPGGYIHCATDWENYSEQMLEVLEGEPLLENLHGAGSRSGCRGRRDRRRPRRRPWRSSRSG